MAIALLLAAALAWWLHKRGELLPNLVRYAGTGAAGLIAVRLLTSGKPLMAVIAAGIAYAWWLAQKPKSATPESSARALLGLPENADADAIQAAWRTCMAQAHPDAGGSDEAAHAVTAARDLLLARKSK
nr:molecular chaperone DnaJ [Polymorphobacter sp.]